METHRTPGAAQTPGAITAAASANVPHAEAAAAYPFRQWLDPDELARIHEAQPDLFDRLTQSWDEDQAFADEAHAFIGSIRRRIGNVFCAAVMLGCVGIIVSGAL